MWFKRQIPNEINYKKQLNTYKRLQQRLMMMRKKERKMDHMDVSPFPKAIQNNVLAHEEET
jgi:hypothetical protein